jgi:hypothetical protein
VARHEGDHGADVDELFTVPPDEFVATRNALTKRLKAAGERDRAAEIATWRRPTPIDWALNQVARDDAEAVERFTETATAARDAQAAALSGRREDLRAAVAEVRESSATVSALAAAVLAGQGRPTAPARAAVSTRLAEIAAEPSLAAQLAAGRLGAGAVEAEGVFELARDEDDAAAPGRRPTRTRVGDDQARAPAEHTATDRAGRAEAKKQAAADAKRERERARAVEKAERADASARVALATANEALERAEAACAAARKELDRSEREREKAVAERDRRRDAALAAAEALEHAQQL